MKCFNCGSEVNNYDKFCNNCGATVNGSSPVDASYNVSGKKSSALFWSLFVVIILTAVFCFLPYASVLGFDFNYVYADLGLGNPEIKDGIFILVFSALSMLFLLLKKRIPVLVFEIASLAIFIIDFVSDSNKVGNVLKYEAGFYLVLIAIIVGIVLALLRVILKRKFK